MNGFKKIRERWGHRLHFEPEKSPPGLALMVFPEQAVFPISLAIAVTLRYTYAQYGYYTMRYDSERSSRSK